MKFLVHFTTIPPRFSYLKETIESWLNQSFPIEKIVISFPKEYVRMMKDGFDERFQIEWGRIEYWLKIYKNVELQILDKDYGPNTKVFGALHYFNKLNEKDKEDLNIIICDDDLKYHTDCIQSYVDSLKENKEQIVFTHFQGDDRLKIKDQNIQHLQGADTYLLSNNFLRSVSLKNYKSFLQKTIYKCPDAWYQDDYVFSYFVVVKAKYKIKTVKSPKMYKIAHLITELHHEKEVHLREQNTINYFRNILI
jgi:hypothetical protein